MHVDLARSETDAFRGVHGLEHIVSQLPHRIIHDGDGCSRGTQSRIGILENCQLCHGSYEMDIVFLAEVSC